MFSLFDGGSILEWRGRILNVHATDGNRSVRAALLVFFTKRALMVCCASLVCSPLFPSVARLESGLPPRLRERAWIA
jgi:hypothetical protein